MSSFSQRMGYAKVRDELQIESVDQPLRNGLWNVVCDYFVIPSDQENEQISRTRTMRLAFIDPGPSDLIPEWLLAIWLDYRHATYDDIPSDWPKARSMFREWFFSCPWNETYDLIEFLADHCREGEEEEDVDAHDSFISDCNAILAKHWAGYRFVGGQISPIVGSAEIEEINTTIELNGSFSSASRHIKRALELLSDRQNPDFRNSIKESISAVESACRAITGERRGVLSKTLRKLEDSGISVHPALRESFEKLYGYAGDEDGIRHAMSEDSKVDLSDAQFMLVSCSAFINYLVAKSTAAGIELQSSDR
jgi:hypothetical protein